MTNLTIIVPHVGSDKQLESTLVSVLENVPANSEILVVHDGSYEDQYDLGEEVRFLEVTPQRSSRRAGRKNLGLFLDVALSETNSEVIHIIGEGIQASPCWSDASMDRFEDPYVGSTCPVILKNRVDDQVEIVGVRVDSFLRRREVGANQRFSDNMRNLELIGPTTMGSFYRTSALRQIGSLTRLSSSNLDVEINLALQRIGFETTVEVDSLLVADQDESGKPFSEIQLGADSQRTIWKFAALDGVPKSILMSIAAIGIDVLCAPLNMNRLMTAVGRIQCLVEFGKHRSMLRTISVAEGPTLVGGSTLAINQYADDLAADDESDFEDYRRVA